MGVPSFTLMPRVRIKLGESYAVISDRKLAPSSDGTAEIFRIMLWDDSRITIRSESTGKLLTTRSPESEFINDMQENEDFTLYAAADEAFSWFTNEAFQLTDENGDIIHFNADNAYRFWEDSRIKGISGHGGSLVLGFETVSDVDTLLKEASESEKMEKDSRIVACFGLHPIVNCKEERDRDSIELPPFQRAVLRRIRENFDQIALVLMANAPVAITEEDSSDEIKAILWTATGS
jgi:beta-glucosidase